jgi:hypothetical protein
MPNGRRWQDELALKYGLPRSPFPFQTGEQTLYRYYDPRVGGYVVTPIPPPSGVPVTFVYSTSPSFPVTPPSQPEEGRETSKTQ